MWRVAGAPLLGAGIAVMVTRAAVNSVAPAVAADGLTIVAAIAGILCGGVWAARPPRVRTDVFLPLAYAAAACLVVALAGVPITAMRMVALGAPVALLVALGRRPR